MTVKLSFGYRWIEILLFEKMVSGNIRIIDINYGNKSNNQLINLFLYTKNGLGSKKGWYLNLLNKRRVTRITDKYE